MSKGRAIAAVGLRFGRLVAVEHRRGQTPNFVWRCDCGSLKPVNSCDVVTGKVRSCGCLDAERRLGARNPQYKHGLSRTPLHQVWKGMLNRCRNPAEPGFRNYGARGIKVCDRWLTFMNFHSDMAAGYARGLTIERIDVNGDYEPGNCCWIPFARQAVNRRTTPRVSYRGEVLAFADAWRASGCVVGIDTAWSRFHKYGWDLERSFSTPPLIDRRPRSAA